MDEKSKKELLDSLLETLEIGGRWRTDIIDSEEQIRYLSNLVKKDIYEQMQLRVFKEGYRRERS